MTVILHAQNQATTADYNKLSPTEQAVIDKAMERADAAQDGKTYVEAMEFVALAAGIPLPASHDLAICDCYFNGCGCGLIFDTAGPGLIITAGPAPKCNLSRLQCDSCSHDHGRPIAN